jgi:hypothetical protein
MLTLTVILTTVVAFVAIEASVSYVVNTILGGQTQLSPSKWYRSVTCINPEIGCRELHIFGALLLGTIDGSIMCWWQGYSLVPVLAAAATIEVSWLLLTNVLWRPEWQSYFLWPQLGVACLAGTIVCIVASIMLGVAATPILIAGALSAVTFALMIPL